MIKKRFLLPVLVATFAASPAMANGSVQNLTASSQHSVQAVGHGLKGSTQVVSGIAAVPLKVVKATGELGGKLGDRLQHYANDTDQGFDVSEETISAGPAPDLAVQR